MTLLDTTNAGDDLALQMRRGELVDDAPFFAPSPSGLFDSLMGQYQALRADIETASSFMHGPGKGTIGYFLDGNFPREGRYSGLRVGEELYKLEGAIAALDADFWSRAMAMTDVREVMPQARRDEWDEAISGLKCPPFTEENVRSTIGSLLDSRERFLAEKIDGIFRGLSGNHVTNLPTGFSRRMILEYVFSDWGGLTHSRPGLIHDLRCVIARFMGLEPPRFASTNKILTACRASRGQWRGVDGGALRIRAFKKGTAHLEVHGDMAWRLNAMLAHLYPQAIPAPMRTKPDKPGRQWKPLQRPIPHPVLEVIAQLGGKHCERHLPYGDYPKDVRLEAIRVLESIGGVVRDGTATFDYDPDEVLDDIVVYGCLPDQVSFQYYPTPEPLARTAVLLAEIEPQHRVLEPSAGQGGIAMLMPKEQVTAVEVSALHAAVLRSRGYGVELADFLEWAKTSRTFDRIVMNPPFADGRALAHLQAAAGLLAKGGRLVAILPASLRGKKILPGLECRWGEVIHGAFVDANVAVCLLTADRR